MVLRRVSLSGAKYVRKMQRMRRLNASIIDTIDDVLDRGRREGVFRGGFDAVELHMTIAALGWFQVANRHTFGYLFRRDLASGKAIERNRALVTDVVMRFVGSDVSRKQPAARPERRDKRPHTIAASEAVETFRG